MFLKFFYKHIILCSNSQTSIYLLPLSVTFCLSHDNKSLQLLLFDLAPRVFYCNFIWFINFHFLEILSYTERGSTTSMAGRNFVLREVPLKWPLPKMRWGPDPKYHTLLVREMQRHSITHKWHLDRTSITKKQIFKTQVFKSNQIFQTLRNCAHGDVMYSK